MKSERLQCESLTFFGGVVACFGGTLALHVIVFGAFIPASDADFHAEFTNFLGKVGIVRQKVNGQCADISGVAAQLNAPAQIGNFLTGK